MGPIGRIDGIWGNFGGLGLIPATHPRISAHSGGTLACVSGLLTRPGARRERRIFLFQILFSARRASRGNGRFRIAAPHQLLEPVTAGFATVFVDRHDASIIHFQIGL
jgi:hypothetical protein